MDQEKKGKKKTLHQKIKASSLKLKKTKTKSLYDNSSQIIAEVLKSKSKSKDKAEVPTRKKRAEKSDNNQKKPISRQKKQKKYVYKKKQNNSQAGPKQKKIKKQRKNKKQKSLLKQKQKSLQKQQQNNVVDQKPKESQTMKDVNQSNAQQDEQSVKQQFLSQYEEKDKNDKVDQKSGSNIQNQVLNQNSIQRQKQNFDDLDIYQQQQQNGQKQLTKVLQAYRDQLNIMDCNELSVPIDSNASESNKKLKQVPQDQYTPTYREISLILQMFKEKFPHKNIDKIIIQLHRSLVEQNQSTKQDLQQILSQKQLDNTSQFSQSIANCEDNMKAICERGRKGIVKRYIRDPEKTIKFVNFQQQMRHNQKVLVARAFCNRDYGIQAVHDEINESKSNIIIDRGRYKTLVSSIAAQSYRRLQKFLIYECKKNIRALNKDEMRSIYSILQNCRRNFETEECSTYMKFMRLTYEIASVTITQEAAIKLYIVIQKALKSRIGEMQLDRLNDTMRCNKEFKAKRSFQNQRFQLHKIWTNELEDQFLMLYKKSQQIVKIRDYFKQKYARNQHLFTIQSLRSRFNKILRVALRKVSCFCQKFGQQRVPNLIKLNDLKVKFILRSPQALNARLLLVDMYLYDECDIKRLYQTVAAVNEFVIMKQNQRMNQIIEAQPLISSANDKIQHNVYISKNKGKVNKEELPDDIYLKSDQKNYQHIVQTQKGRNLHYYRKVGAQNNGGNKISSMGMNDLKQEDAMQIEQHNRKNQMQAKTIINSRLEQDSLLSFERPVQEGGQIYINPNNGKSDQGILQDLIRQEMQKFYYQRTHGFPRY